MHRHTHNTHTQVCPKSVWLAHTRTNTHAHTHTHTRVSPKSCIHSTHTRTHAHMYPYTHTHTHTYTHKCPRRSIHEVRFLEPLGGQQTQEHPPCPLPSMSFFCAFSFVISSSVSFFFSACLAFLFLYFSLSSSQSSIPFQPYNNHSATIYVHSTFRCAYM